MVTFWSRINTALLLLVLLAVVGLFATRAYGGPLDPPGPPAATDGVRQPGTPISSLPFAITTPGYYYVTRNLTGGTGQTGITITSSNVTLDLGGFTLFGGTSPGDGISANGPRYVRVRNGSVRGWSTGINLIASYSTIEGVRATNNLLDGIRIGGGSEITNCIASLNGNDGIDASFVVVRDCVVAGNTDSGIRVLDYSLVEDNRAHGNGKGIVITGSFNTLRNNDASFSAGTNGDIHIDVGANSNVLIGNVFCDIVVFGANTSTIGNVDRVDAC